MSAHHADTPFPRLPLIGAGTLVAAALIFATAGRLTGAVSLAPEASIVAQHELKFEDRANGAVAVYEDGAAQPTTIVNAGTNGFLRGTMRALARDRNQHEIGRNTPFKLTVWSDGRLTLEDPAVGRRVELQAFGPTNAGAFAKLIGLTVVEPAGFEAVAP